MTANVTRLALPFTDADIASHADVRIYNAASTTLFTVSILLPALVTASPDAGYYNGGDLGGGDTTTFAQPDESLVMALATVISSHGFGFHLDVTEDSNLPGRYTLERQDGLAWEILWGDALTTFDPAWLGFLPTTYASTTGIITAVWQSARLWRGSRPTWNRRKLGQTTSHAKTLSGGVATRQISDTREEWDLRFAAQVGPTVYVHDGTIQPLVDMTPGMAIQDPNLALEATWMWAAARTPFQYWPDESDLTVSEYARPSVGDELGAVGNLIRAERSSTPPVYDVGLRLISSTAGAVGTGGTECSTVVNITYGTLASYATYNDLPTGGSAPADGTQANVTTTAAAGVYTYVESVDTYTVGMWLPAGVVAQGLSYATDSGGDPCRISCGIGGDDPAAIAARGWTNTAGGAGASIVDSGGDILYTTGTAAPNYALSTFTPVIAGEAELFAVLELDGSSYVSGNSSQYGATISIIDGARRILYSQTASGVNTGSFFAEPDTTPTVVGDGEIGLSAFDRVFLTTPWAPSSNNDDQATAWEANSGAGVNGDSAGAAHSDFTASASTVVVVQCDAVTGVNKAFTVRELHVFEVG